MTFKLKIIATSLLCLCINSIIAQNVPTISAELTKEQKEYLLKFVYPIKTCEPESINNDDLKILNQLVGASKVVALGENTHGSSEIFKMKDRIIRYLSQNNDFDIFR